MSDRKHYQQQYWQAYTKDNRRIYGVLTALEYREMKYRADQHDRGVFRQIWLESVAYRKQERLLSKPIEDELRLVKIEIRRIGTNINQIAKQSNIFHKLLQDRQLLKQLQALENHLEHAVKSLSP